MASNSSTLIISIAIGILLLLILLLLLSYNSKPKSDKVERFEGEENVGDMLSGGGNLRFKSYEDFTSDMGINGGSSEEQKYRQRRLAVQSMPETYVNSNDKKEGFANMEGASLDSSYSLLGEAKADNNNVYKDPSACFKRDRLTATDLLPSDASSKWAQINPSSSGELSDQNFLTAGYHVGINTIGQSMRNANLQLRSEVPNPQVAVSPWLISTIEPDVRPVSFEIGSAPQTPPS